MAHRLKGLVQERAGGRCEYCGLPEERSELDFQCDHIIARKHKGADEASNLAYSCPDCNYHKQSNIAGMDPGTGRLVRLFNPRTDVWEEHFEWRGVRLLGRTDIGRTTVEVLAVNDADRLFVRRNLREEGLNFGG